MYTRNRICMMSLNSELLPRKFAWHHHPRLSLDLMLAQFQPALLYFMVFDVLGVEAFPTSRTVPSRQEYSYVATLLAICFFLALLFLAKWIYLSRCRRKQVNRGIRIKYQTDLESCDHSSSAAPHSTATNTQKSAFLVGLLGSPSWETRNSVIFGRVSSYLPFSRPYSIPSSPRNQSGVSPERDDQFQFYNFVLSMPVESALMQPQTHSTALLSCQSLDDDPAISTTSTMSQALDNSTEANPVSWQMNFSPQPQKSMLYDKDTAMRQISGLDFSYKLLPSSLRTVIASPKPALLCPRQIRRMHWQQSTQLCRQDSQVNQTSTNTQADIPSWPSLTPKIHARNCESSVPIGFVPPKPVLRVSDSMPLVRKTVIVGKESTGLPCTVTQTLKNTSSFDTTCKCGIHQKSPLHLLENFHGDQHQLSTEEADTSRLIPLRSLKIRSPTKRVRGSPKPGPSPLRTMFLPVDECENSVTSKACDQDCALDDIQISGSPDQSFYVDEHALSLSNSFRNAAQSKTSAVGATCPTQNTCRRPLNRFKANVDLQDKLISVLLEELVHETSEWDDSLFVNNNFKAMIDSSCGALEMQTHSRKKTNPRVSQKLYSSSFSRLEDIPEVDGRSICTFVTKKKC